MLSNQTGCQHDYLSANFSGRIVFCCQDPKGFGVPLTFPNYARESFASAHYRSKSSY